MYNVGQHDRFVSLVSKSQACHRPITPLYNNVAMTVYLLHMLQANMHAAKLHSIRSVQCMATHDCAIGAVRYTRFNSKIHWLVSRLQVMHIHVTRWADLLPITHQAPW